MTKKLIPMLVFIGLALGAALLETGCATPGPILSTVQRDIPPVPSGYGRVYTYRSSVIGSASQPEVKLDGKVIGTARPNVVTFADMTPGEHMISCTTEKTNRLDFTIASGETKYVKLVPYVGFFIAHVDPQIVPVTEGERDVSDMHLLVNPDLVGRVPASLLAK